MLSITAIKPLNRWDYDSIRPGVVGSVGETSLQVKLKHSNPDMPLRFSKTFSKDKLKYLGSNVQNGDSKSFQSKGKQARSYDGYYNLEGRRFKTQRGFKITDIRAEDRTVEPTMSSLYDYSWRNKIAKTVLAKTTGSRFTPLPGSYQLPPGAIPRGAQVPSVVEAENPVKNIVGGRNIENYPVPSIFSFKTK
jgi:hypothetical protein